MVFSSIAVERPIRTEITKSNQNASLQSNLIFVGLDYGQSYGFSLGRNRNSFVFRFLVVFIIIYHWLKS